MHFKETAFDRRERRVRYKLKKTNSGKPRLSVFRSGKYIYAQLIDDANSSTLAAASSLEKAFQDSGTKSRSNIEAATKVGDIIGKRALEKGIKEVVFDRGGYLYHGRVKALAEAARHAGLNF